MVRASSNRGWKPREYVLMLKKSLTNFVVVQRRMETNRETVPTKQIYTGKLEGVNLWFVTGEEWC